MLSPRLSGLPPKNEELLADTKNWMTTPDMTAADVTANHGRDHF